MCLMGKSHYCTKHHARKLGGFSMPVTIFLLTIMSIMLVSLVQLNKLLNKQSVAEELDSTAEYSVKILTEYALYQANRNNSCPATAVTIAMTNDSSGLMKGTYTCNESSTNEAGKDIVHYVIKATVCRTQGASCPEPPGRPQSEDYVEKSLTAIFVK